MGETIVLAVPGPGGQELHEQLQANNRRRGAPRWGGDATRLLLGNCDSAPSLALTKAFVRPARAEAGTRETACRSGCSARRCVGKGSSFSRATTVTEQGCEVVASKSARVNLYRDKRPVGVRGLCAEHGGSALIRARLHAVDRRQPGPFDSPSLRAALKAAAYPSWRPERVPEGSIFRPEGRPGREVERRLLWLSGQRRGGASAGCLTGWSGATTSWASSDNLPSGSCLWRLLSRSRSVTRASLARSQVVWK
jgi:hypothetical protein